MSVGNCRRDTEYLHMSKIHACWALRLLKDSEERRVRDSKSFLKHYEKDGALSKKRPVVKLEHPILH